MGSTFILRALDRNGSESYYTGREGREWTSANVYDAFTYRSLECARHKAALLNRAEHLHGLWFFAKEVEASR